jgi:hypothetical protein
VTASTEAAIWLECACRRRSIVRGASIAHARRGGLNLVIYLTK